MAACKSGPFGSVRFNSQQMEIGMWGANKTQEVNAARDHITKANTYRLTRPSQRRCILGRCKARTNHEIGRSISLSLSLSLSNESTRASSAQSSEENAGGRPRLALALAPRSEKCHSREYKRDLANVLSRTEESIRWDEQERRDIIHQVARSSTEYSTCMDTSFFFSLRKRTGGNGNTNQPV